MLLYWEFIMDQLFDLNPQVTAVISFILGGGLTALLKSTYDYYRTVKLDDQAFDERELSKYKDKTASLEQRILSLESAQVQSCVPEWRKDCTGRYEFVNLAYEMTILLPLGKQRSDIIGKTDEEIFEGWPEFVSLIKSLDKEAVISIRKFAIRRNVIFPSHQEQVMLIKEVAQSSFDGRIILIGRSYPETLIL